MTAPRSGGTAAPRAGELVRGPFIAGTPWKVPFGRAGRRRRDINLILILCQRERPQVASGSEGQVGQQRKRRRAKAAQRYAGYGGAWELLPGRVSTLRGAPEGGGAGWPAQAGGRAGAAGLLQLPGPGTPPQAAPGVSRNRPATARPRPPCSRGSEARAAGGGSGGRAQRSGGSKPRLLAGAHGGAAPAAAATRASLPRRRARGGQRSRRRPGQQLGNESV